MSDSDRFTNNQNGSITDKKYGLMWTREDSWQTEAKWFTWDEAKDHVRFLNDEHFAGHTDWRIPSTEEAQTLYDPEAVNQDKYDKNIHLDPVFPPGPLATVWLDDDFSSNEGSILDFSNGEIRGLYKSKSGRMAVRPVRNLTKPNLD